MISTVTTATVAMIAGGISLSLVAVLALVALLAQKEIVSASGSRQARPWGRILNVGIVPLLLAFVFIVVVKLVEMLQ